MKPFSQTILRLSTESAFAVGPEISYWESQGYNIVKLNIGEPGCNIVPSATQAAIKSFKNHETHYTPSAGFLSLREKISRYLQITREIDFKPEDIILTPGGKPVIAGTLFILVNPGEEVVYPTPCYPIYESIINFISAKPKPILLKESEGFRFRIEDLKKVLSKKTKLLILNSPSNPTGGILTQQDLKQISFLAKKYDFYILSDEIYSRIVFGDQFKLVNFQGKKIPVAPSIASLPGMAQRTIILDGFSKTYAMTGLRLGFCATKNKKFMEKFLTYAINIWSCLPAPCMKAAEAALDDNQNLTQKEILLYQEKRDFMVKKLNQIKGVVCHNPLGAFYLFPNVTQVCRRLKLKDAEALRKYLLTYDKKNKKGVAVLSRQHFGKPLKSETQQYIRISIAGSFKDLKEGVKRLQEALG